MSDEPIANGNRVAERLERQARRLDTGKTKKSLFQNPVPGLAGRKVTRADHRIHARPGHAGHRD